MKLLKLGFTGTQAGMTRYQRKQLLHHLNRWVGEGYTHLEIHHGDCIGADEQFHDLCVDFWPSDRLTVVVHPPVNETKRAFVAFPGQTVLPARPYLERNHAIVDAVDGMLASPKELREQLRSGTWATVRYARKTGVPLILMAPARQQ